MKKATLTAETPNKAAAAYGKDAREAAMAADYDAWTCPHFFGEAPRTAAGEITSKNASGTDCGA